MDEMINSFTAKACEITINDESKLSPPKEDKKIGRTIVGIVEGAGVGTLSTLAVIGKVSLGTPVLAAAAAYVVNKQIFKDEIEKEN